MHASLQRALVVVLLALSACSAVHWLRGKTARWRDGWYRVASVAQPVELRGSPDDPQHYADRFSRIDFDDHPGCPPEGDDPGSPLFVFVHGIGGDQEEWHDVVPLIDATSPRGMYMFRWSRFTKADVLAARLARGVSELARCGSPITILAHSAGGVLAARAAERFELPAPPTGKTPWVLITVASPLAGMGRSDERDDDESVDFFRELGARTREYAPGPEGLAVVHMRTAYPADTVMAPSIGGHEPNRLGVGVPGALEIDLPADLGHVEALPYVAAQIASGDWHAWLDPEFAALSRRPSRPEPAHVCRLGEDILADGDPWVVPSFDGPPGEEVRLWDGSTLPEQLPPPAAYTHCRPCTCGAAQDLEPWNDWVDLNRRAYARLRTQRVPYPVAIVPGFVGGGMIARNRLTAGVELLAKGWVGALIVSGGHRRDGDNQARALYKMAFELGAAMKVDVTDRILIEPCAATTVTHLRNGLRMMAVLGLPYGLFVTDSKMSGQAILLYGDLEELVPRDLRCAVGRVSYLSGDGPRPRLGARDTGCQPPLSWRNNPLGFLLPSRRPSVFWVSPTSREGEVTHSAAECRGGGPRVTDLEPDDEDPTGATCLPVEGEHSLTCGSLLDHAKQAVRKGLLGGD